MSHRKDLLDTALQGLQVFGLLNEVERNQQVGELARRKAQAGKDLTTALQEINAQADAAATDEERERILLSGSRRIIPLIQAATGQFPGRGEVESAVGLPSVEQRKFETERREQANISGRLQDLLRRSQRDVLFDTSAPTLTDPTRVATTLREAPPGMTQPVPVPESAVFKAIVDVPKLADILLSKGALNLLPGTGSIGATRLNEALAAASPGPRFVSGSTEGLEPKLQVKSPESLEQIQSQAVLERGGSPSIRQANAFLANQNPRDLQHSVDAGFQRVQAIKTQLFGGRNELGVLIPATEGTKLPLAADLLAAAQDTQDKADALAAQFGTPRSELFPGLLPDQETTDTIARELRQRLGRDATPREVLLELSRRLLNSPAATATPTASAPLAPGVVDAVKRFLGLGP